MEAALRPSGARSVPQSPQSPQSPHKKHPQPRQAVRDLLAKVQLEEKIRDGAESMLQDLQFTASTHHSHSKYKVKSSSHQSDAAQHRRKVQEQVEAAESRIQDLKRQLRSLGHDIDASESPASSSDDNEDTSDSRASGVNRRPSVADLALAPSPIAKEPAQQPQDATPLAVRSLSMDSLETSSRYFVRLFGSLDPGRSGAAESRTVDKLTELFGTFPALRTEIAVDQACEKIKGFFTAGGTPQATILGLRLCQILAVDRASLDTMRPILHLNWLIVQSLAREDSTTWHNERLQALHFVRRCLQLGSINVPVVRALVAVAEQATDKLRPIAIETLAELLVVDPTRAFEGGAIKVLLTALVDSPAGIAVSLAMAMLAVLDHPEQRHYLRGGRDLEVVMTGFTDIQLYGMSSPSAERLATVSAVLCTILRNWAGIQTFDVALVVECLGVPVRNVQETLLGVISRVLKSPGTSQTSMSQHFSALLLHKLLQAGMADRLALLQENGVHSSVQMRAKQLSSDLCELGAQLLPRILISPELPPSLQQQIDRATPSALPTASLPLFEVDVCLRDRERERRRHGGGAGVDGSSGPLYQQLHYHHHHQFARIMGAQLDDGTWKQLVAATHVLDTKMYKQWNWDVLLELIQGPLRHPKRLDDAVRGSKFMKRLVSFYRPFKYRFSNLHISKDHLRYVHVGKELILALLDTPEGLRYLGGNKLLRQIAECLAQLDPDSGITSAEPLFSARRFKTTLCYAYIEMIGVLTGTPVGQQILAQMRIFNMLGRIVLNTQRDDVVRSVLSSLDYTLDGHPRVILAQAMTGGSRSIRRFATERLHDYARLVCETYDDPNQDEGLQQLQWWLVELLVNQLYDADMDVCQAAVRALVMLCSMSGSCLDHFIALRPYMNHLGDTAAPLNMLFLSRSGGFEALQADSGWVVRELDSWAHGFNDAYAEQIEEYLERENSVAAMHASAGGVRASAGPGDLEPEDDQDDPLLLETQPPHILAKRQVRSNANPVPPRHFFGELVRTEPGCGLLSRCGHVQNLAAFVAAHKMSTSPNDVRRLKGALWALGHVASRPLGAALITSKIVSDIVSVYASSQIYSLRGTAWYALGLISQSFEGAELLWEAGWVVAYDVWARPRGITLPYKVAQEDLPNPTKSLANNPTNNATDMFTNVFTNRSTNGSTNSPDTPNIPTSTSGSGVLEHLPVNVLGFSAQTASGSDTQQQQPQPPTPIPSILPQVGISPSTDFDFDLGPIGSPDGSATGLSIPTPATSASATPTSAGPTPEMGSTAITPIANPIIALPGNMQATTTSALATQAAIAAAASQGVPSYLPAQHTTTSSGSPQAAESSTPPRAPAVSSTDATALSASSTNGPATGVQASTQNGTQNGIQTGAQAGAQAGAQTSAQTGPQAPQLVEFPPVRESSTIESILRSVSDLSNFVLAHEASKRLVALRASHPSLFQSPDVFRDTMHLLEQGHYKQLVRRFLFELFDVPAVLQGLYRRRGRSRS